MYDGFISYSHAADELLAPRIQAALQRFAKPWWRRRALRIFRDEASLSANPHLWGSIVEAMEHSEWFVLLLSPEAARSEWVDREVSWWLEHKDAARIIPVLTEGRFGWEGGLVSDAAPPALAGAFSDEPRWVDLRFGRADEQLDLKNPAFAGAVADIASAIRGVPKDELASEEVRQHRRTIRTAWAAGVALLGLTIFSVVVALFALDQQERAEQNAEEAQANEALAQENADQAQESADREAEARREAEREAAISEMRLLEARSVAETGGDPELATLLALLAVATGPETHRSEVMSELRSAIAANRLIARFENPTGMRVSHTYGVISDDGSTVFAVQELDEGQQVAAIDVATGATVDTYHLSNGYDMHTEWLAVSVSGLLAFDVISHSGGGGSIHVVDTSTGTTVQVLPLNGCPEVGRPPEFSPDGRYLSFMDGTEDCVEPGTPLRQRPEADWAVVYETSTWEEVIRWEEPEAFFEWIQFGSGPDTALLTSCAEQFLCDLALVFFPTLEPIESYRGFYPSLSKSGDLLVSLNVEFQSAFGTTEIRDLTTGGVVYLDQGDRPLAVSGDFPYYASPDGRLVAVVVEPIGAQTSRLYQSATVIDSETGATVILLPEFPREREDRPSILGISWTGNGERLLTSHPEGLLLWDVNRFTERSTLAAIQDPVELGLETLTRGFTLVECQRFALEPCPTTVDELRDLLADVS